jgi:ketosteroid isomerase-like protein
MRSGGTAEDQLGIRELIELYSDACIQRDVSVIADLWVEDGYWGVLDMPELVGRGKAEILERWKRGQAFFPKAIVLSFPGRISINGDNATCRTYTGEVVTAPDGKVRKALGLYDDAFRKVDGRWYFSQRIWSPLHEEGTYVHAERVADAAE